VYLLTIKKEVQLRKRRTYDNNFKARVVLEAIKGEKTISEIAGQYEVNPIRSSSGKSGCWKM
jgi:transposase-like protein